MSTTLAAYSVAVPLTPWPNRFSKPPKQLHTPLFIIYELYLIYLSRPQRLRWVIAIKIQYWSKNSKHAEYDPFPSFPARFLFSLSLALSKTQRGFRLRRTELIHVHSIQILSKITEKQSLTESLTTFKTSTSMFSTIDEIFHKHTISFQQTVTILSLSNYHSPRADPHQPHCNTPKIL